MFVRRSAAVLAATAVIGAALAPAALADASPSASPELPSALYGSGDPTYDGVWRQSLALLAQDTAGVAPAAAAVGWLAGQQCADGAFAPYRADPDAACDAKTAVDTNSTAAAVQALAALGGHDAATGKAVTWLKSVQNEDGGWGYTPGGASDTNSTSAVVGALAAAGEEPRQVRSGGRSPYDALRALAVPCGRDGGGAFAFQPDEGGALTANADATAAGVLGALGEGFVVAPGKSGKDEKGEKGETGQEEAGGGCAAGSTAADAARNGAAYLAGALAADGHLTSALPGAEDRPDYGNTADAVVALAAAGRTADAGEPLTWLEENAASWAAKSGPAAYAQLVLAAHATGADPRDFGGTDLVERLNATGPAPRASGERTAAAETGDDGVSVGWFIGGGLAVGVLGGLLLSLRGGRRRP
ncbi:prenyltransferase/squalene oxidase repeat-containing protein [Streptomyces minutiscleroticus]|uniref:Secreted protein n=1 Tax=Streptomyces minutiscleroticus TaxID=68238 RepID=A0A918K7I5_9ACTN|nr:prenyltransferase/squalene oxidase repeat-containing protein [Streptomyces minutiscleroticus]GGX52488.1 hypothetical protein GCM10010358_02730 [Streptomyces minutiscleroticus]